jgi:hypothetical protein
MALSRRAPALRFDTLEDRDVPSGTWLTDAFDSGEVVGASPGGWFQWSSTGPAAPYTVSAGAALSGSAGLALTGYPAAEARAWIPSVVPGDFGVAANVQPADSGGVGVLVRGTGLNTTTASYLAATVSIDGRLDVIQFVNGLPTRLLTITPSNPAPKGAWYQVSLVPAGTIATISVQRLDTGEYLSNTGDWTATTTATIPCRTGWNPPSGAAGLVRFDTGFGTAAVDDFTLTAPGVIGDTFGTAANGAVPAGWATWATPIGTTPAFSVTAGRLTGTGPSNQVARAWTANALPADLQVTGSVLADSLIPAGVLARGSALDTTRPTYYAATITRGLVVQLTSVVGGVETVLGSVKSTAYTSGQLVQVTLALTGDRIQAFVFRTDTQKWLSATGAWQDARAAALDVRDGSISQIGPAGFLRKAGAAGTITLNSFAAQTTFDPTAANPASTAPAIPRHYSHIRIAELAYDGNPMGPYEQALLQSSVDLVIPNAKYLATINSVAPATPQLIYSNVSNLYLGLLTDWLTYADQNGASRESAFYHVTAATPFQGTSASSQPVTYFWGVTRVTSTWVATDLTAASQGGRTYGVEFGAAGTTDNIGYLEKFREINVTLNRPATAGWGGVWEYATAVDASGNVTAWKPLTLISDGTNTLKQNGRITFDPPADWVAGAVPGKAGRNYYVRFRVTAGTAAQGPEAKTILGRDYVNANGGTTGTIPAFDYTADKDGDGYLNDAEYANRATGKDARFVYESRLFYPYYGQMRFVTNPSAPIVQQWAADYHQRFLAANPLADGVMLDNSLGKIPVAGIPLAESTANYGTDFGRMIATIKTAIAPKFVLANTAGGGAAADPVAASSTASFEEFLLRPMDVTWSGVNDVAALVRRRLGAATPSPYLVIDSNPGSAGPTDPRTQLATLAYYYLVADPDKTFLMFFGGYAPASGWQYHWSPAAAVDVGQPTGAMTTFATGVDPQNPALTYKVYGRTYGNALVLYKPRSYTPGVGTGTTDDATATTHLLNGNYRQVNADGTLGPVINKITLRNGEGAVLIRA